MEDGETGEGRERDGATTSALPHVVRYVTRSVTTRFWTTPAPSVAESRCKERECAHRFYKLYNNHHHGPLQKYTQYDGGNTRNT